MTRPHHPARPSRLAFGLLGLLAVGCIGVPQPQPPSLDPVGVVPGNGRGSQYGFAVAPGSIEPPEGTLFVVGLDDANDPLLLPVEDDGSVGEFELSSSHLRLQVRVGDARDTPWDFVRSSGTVSLIERVNPCFDVDLDVEVGSVQVGRSVEASVELVNRCDDAIVLADAAMRRASDLELLATPTTIDAGASARVTVRLTPSAAGLREEVLLISIASPLAERRAVTLFGRGLP
ncbi:MAG: hypothetical protein AB7S26_02695 [Sandaracinaceae bacterium]